MWVGWLVILSDWFMQLQRNMRSALVRHYCDRGVYGWINCRNLRGGEKDRNQHPTITVRCFG